MSLGSLGMARSALGTALSLLLLTHIIQGLQVPFKVFHYKKMEAVEGQDVALPCLLNSTSLQLGNIEWSRRRDKTTSLVVYNALYGLEYFWPNVTIQIENNTMGSYLHLNRVTRGDSGTYICQLSTFPLGTIKRETELTIRDSHVTCDVESPVQVNVGENVTIQCNASPDSHYRWTKNKTLVSKNEYLKLLWVTDADAGLYILTVDTGSTSQHKEFIITVLRATTSQWTDVWTKQPQSTASEKGLTETPDADLTTSTPAGEHLTSNTDVTSTATTAADGTHNPSNAYVTAGQNVTSYTNYTQTAVTSSPPTHSDPYKSDNSSDHQTNQTQAASTSPFPDHSASSNLSTSYGTTVFHPTDGMRNESAIHTVHPDVSPSTSLESSTPGGFTADSNSTDVTSTAVAVNVEVKKDGTQSHLLVLMIIPVLVLIAVAAFLYRKQIIKKRMDLPPPFKPPPPPVKYTAARRREILTEPAYQGIAT